MHRISIILLQIQSLFLFLPNTIGQDTHNIDSIQRIIHDAQHDTIKSDAFLALAGEYLSSDPLEAIRFAEQARVHAVQSASPSHITSALGWLAYLYEQTGEYSKALSYNQEALKLAQQTGNKTKQAILLNNIAAYYKDRGDLDTAYHLNLQSLSLREEIKDTTGIADTYNNLGLILQGQGRIEEALDHYSTALSGFEKTGNLEGMATALQNIGVVYKEQREFDAALSHIRRSLAYFQQDGDSYGAGYALNAIGTIYESLHQPDSALYYYNSALQLRRSIDDVQGEAYTLKNIGAVYEAMGRHQEAEDAYQRSLRFFEQAEDKWGETKVTLLYGSMLLRQNKLPQSESLLTRSIHNARSLGYPADISAAAFELQKLFRRQGKMKEALSMFDEYLVMHDSIQNDINRKAAIKTQYRYEYEKKEAILKSEQEKQNAISDAKIRQQKMVRNAFIYGFAGVLLFAIVVLYQRNKIAHEKKRSETLLLNILPREIAEELKQKGEAEARQFDSVTVLFTDFKDFTIKSERMTPRELVNELNLCFKTFDEIVTKYHLEKIKTIGDAYLAVAGLPVAREDHAQAAVEAAFAMRQFMDTRWQTHPEHTFQLRCGIHSGTVVAGIVGVKKYAYDIWGDTVNTAARMEQHGEVGKINISGATYELVKDHYTCVHRGKLDAKNKGMVDMYFVEPNAASGV